MAEKEIKGRIQQKHDIQENWEKATGFIPKIGEIIVYDADTNNPIRLKIGDGVKNVNELPFYEEASNFITIDDIDAICGASITVATSDEVTF